jgi:hypothetical protein
MDNLEDKMPVFPLDRKELMARNGTPPPDGDEVTKMPLSPKRGRISFNLRTTSLLPRENEEEQESVSGDQPMEEQDASTKRRKVE